MALANSTSPYLFPFINLGGKKGRAGKPDLNKGRWLLLLQRFLWGDFSLAGSQMGVLAETEGKQRNRGKEVQQCLPFAQSCTGLYLLPADPWSPLPPPCASSRSQPAPPTFILLRETPKFKWLSSPHPALWNVCEMGISGGLLLHLCKWMGVVRSGGRNTVSEERVKRNETAAFHQPHMHRARVP